MKESFKIYYPTKDKAGLPVDHMLPEFAAHLASVHGGCTVETVQGFDGFTGVAETIYRCFVFCESVDPVQVESYAVTIKKMLNQDSVMYEINGEAFFV